MRRSIHGLLVDLDGTVYQGSSLIEGARETVAALRERAMPFLFTTNTSRKSRRDVTELLRGLGLDAWEEEIFTAPTAAVEWLRAKGLRRVQLLVPESTHADFGEFEITDRGPEAVLVGDLGTGFTFERLNEAFRSLRAGARLVAIHRNRFWLPEGGPTLDAGPFVRALEYASGTEAVLVGKPAPAFFAAAAARLGLAPAELAVVGDDAESDIRGGRAAGLFTVQVRTGKGDPALGPGPGGEKSADRVIPSIRELPGCLP